MLTTYGSGFRRLAPFAALVLAGCAAGQPPDATGTVLKSATLGPAGGTIALTAADSAALAGTSITVPAGALTHAVTIAISASSQAVAQSSELAAGPIVNFAPDGTLFAVPVTMTIPVAIPSGESAAGLLIEAVEGTGAARAIPVESQAGGFATFQTTRFTRFGGVIGGTATDGGPAPCSSDSDCGSCGRCVTGQCVASDVPCVPDGGVICSCPNEPVGGCTVPGSAPCYCPVAVACDGGTGACSTSADCSTGNYCALTGCTGTGTCTAVPEVCPLDCSVPELCGCNGRLYCNSCMANAAGTNVSPDGGGCGAQDAGPAP